MAQAESAHTISAPALSSLRDRNPSTTLAPIDRAALRRALADAHVLVAVLRAAEVRFAVARAAAAAGPDWFR
jgi:hypothetical protein